MALKPNMRVRNQEVNAFVGILVVTIAASIAAMTILKVALDVPFSAFASASAYDIGSMR